MSKAMTWTIAIVYCLVAFGSDALHMLPGCSHSGHRLCLEANQHEGQASHSSHVCCNHSHGHKAAQPSKSQISEQHGDCQVCKLLASISVGFHYVEMPYVANDYLCKANFTVSSADACAEQATIYIRGPPSC